MWVGRYSDTRVGMTGRGEAPPTQHERASDPRPGKTGGMPSVHAIAMAEIVKVVQPSLKSVGYRKSGNRFNRTTEPGIVQVISFQMGAFDPPGTVEIPGLRPNLYGKFTVNLGVFLQVVMPYDKTPPPKSFVNDYNCHIRRRMGNLCDPPADYWWRLDPAAAAPEVRELIDSRVTAWMEHFSTWRAVLADLEAVAPDSRAVRGVGGPDKVLATWMFLAEGNRTQAQQAFSAYVATVDPVSPHYRYLSAFAMEHSLSLC